jgi:hypothetical protein
MRYYVQPTHGSGAVFSFLCKFLFHVYILIYEKLFEQASHLNL